MSFRLLCGVAGGAIFGALLGWTAGNTPIGIAICVAVGAIGAYLWERLDERKGRQPKDGRTLDPKR